MINDHLNIDSSTNQDIIKKKKNIKTYYAEREFETEVPWLFNLVIIPWGHSFVFISTLELYKIYFASQENPALYLLHIIYI